MLYSEKITLNGEDFIIKIGIRELIKLEEAGINLDATDIGFKNLMKAFHIAMSRNDKKLTEEQMIDLFDESEYTLEDLVEVLKNAIEKGIKKHKPDNVVLKNK